MNAPLQGRRRFLKIAGAAAGSFTLPFHLGTGHASAAATAGEPFAPNAFVSVGRDGIVTLTVQRSEMGQGIRTTLAMILCEELDADWPAVRIVQAPGDTARYGDQDTVGDNSLFVSWVALRQAAATARAMLVAAAARRWKVAPPGLRTERGRVLAVDGRSLAYGELVEGALREAPPANVPLKQPADYRLVGKPTAGVDLFAQTTGRLTYGLDVRVPGMLYAVIQRAPFFRGTLKRYNEAVVRAQPGVTSVFALDASFHRKAGTSAGVAIVGTSSWACIRARRALEVEWDHGQYADRDTPTTRAIMEAAADKGGLVYHTRGDVAHGRSESASILKRRYFTPYLTHAPLEPPNCTAHVEADRCTVWVPSQDPGEAHDLIAQLLDLPPSRVTVNVTMIGGGFGRKSLHDFIVEAVLVSRRVKRPVKLFLTREDDIQTGYFKSPCLQELEAGLRPDGDVAFWRHHTIHSSQEVAISGSKSSALEDYEVASGPSRVHYAFDNVQVEGTHVDIPLRHSWMRGVQDFFHAFAANCFMDELAEKAGKDPVAYRLATLPPERLLQFYRTTAPTGYWFDSARMARVIRRAAELSEWDEKPVAGRGRGFASHVQSFTYVAMVAEVERTGESGARVAKVTCVVDCGMVINPDGARAQVEGGIVYGLSCCLMGELTVGKDGIVQSNFHDYPVARIGHTPELVIEFIGSTATPTGLGEPTVPLVGPAVANALANAGLPRRYDMPLLKDA